MSRDMERLLRMSCRRLLQRSYETRQTIKRATSLTTPQTTCNISLLPHSLQFSVSKITHHAKRIKRTFNPHCLLARYILYDATHTQHTLYLGIYVIDISSQIWSF